MGLFSKTISGKAKCSHRFKKQGNTLAITRKGTNKVTGGYYVCQNKGCNATKLTKGGVR